VRPIVFAHGFQGSPDGTKASYLREELDLLRGSPAGLDPLAAAGRC
jgi:predicted esterase YcpF (UPF0227 family)